MCRHHIRGTFCGIAVTDVGPRFDICVTDIDVDMRGVKDQLQAEDWGFA